MLDNIRIDTFSSVYDLLKPLAVEEFWEFADCTLIHGSTYIIGRKQLVENIERVVDMCASNNYTVIFDGAAEGSWTLQEQLRILKLDALCQQGKLLVIGGGDMPPEYHYMSHEHFINVFFGYQQNVDAMQNIDLIFSKRQKPYDFLFLNGRARPHRKYLWYKLNEYNLLNRSLWTMLDPRPITRSRLQLKDNQCNLLSQITPIQVLPKQYEVEQYRSVKYTVNNPARQFVKMDMFDNTWGEIYLQSEPYIDSYFSLVTETIFEESNYSFRTEKIVKPLAQGHPFIVAANYGYLRDLKKLGFKTFGHVIDESFDTIDDPQKRVDRIADLIKDLCSQDLASFLDSCYVNCKYNQQHLVELRQQLRQKFPERFFNFIKQHTVNK